MTQYTGLDTATVRERAARGLDNYQVDPSTHTIKEIIRENVLTYFNLIFTVLAILLVIVGSFKDLLFMALVVANTLIGIFQEVRSKHQLDRLQFLKMPKAHVLRDGMENEVRVEQLVLGDFVVLRAGNQIPADARVVTGSLKVNESLLTGESDDVDKNAEDQLLSGSYVVSGEALAELTAVGAESYISKLTLEATRDSDSDDSEMISSLDKMVKIIGILIIPVGAVLLFQSRHILGGTFRSGVTAVVAAILGMIPEGLYVTASVAMAVSALRLGRKDVLVQNMRSIESLARIDVLCVDKTGTITENEMQVSGFKALNGEDQEDVGTLLGDFAANMSADNATMHAIQQYFKRRMGKRALHILGFSSQCKYSGAVFDSGNYALGAPEYVMPGSYGQYKEYIGEMSSRGYRVLAFVKTPAPPDGRPLSVDTYPVALIFLENPVRKTAPETFRYFAENGVAIKVLSGDNPATVSHVAVEAGIPGGDHYLDARQLVNERAIYDAIRRYTVFGRVTPDQKRLFVEALQQQGHTVGMTGDGVNDVLALREADCSVAMAGGSEAASNAAQMVLMDSDFSKMPQVVAEGRRVVNNIIKASALYLTKNIFSMMLALFSMISVLQYPLQPSQITFISLFTIGVPSFILSLEPNTDRIKGGFLMNVFKMALPAGLTMFISVSALVVFGQVFRIRYEYISTSATMLVALVGFLYLTKVAIPHNKLHVGMILVLIAGMMACVFFTPGIFGIESITMEAAMLLGLFLVATEGLFRYVYKLAELGAMAQEARIRHKQAKRLRRRRKRKAHRSVLR